jgi:1,5-anhydro-D-fructose reductase (1,5-anhydro-D-mannitol-forming)
MKIYDVGIIGLGCMGRNMLTSMAEHDRFQVLWGWDPSVESSAAAKAQQPDLQIFQGPDEVIAHDQVDLVYIAAPPLNHKAYVLKTIAAGKPVYCEKPLGVDIFESRRLVTAMEDSGLANIINFNLATALSTTIVKKQLDTGQLGPVAGITINLHVPQWPRAFQSSAGWLKGRTQGGYCREVFSHWIYLTRRLLGDGTLKHANTHFPTDSTLCETFVQAELDFGGVPVYLSGITGGAGPVGVEYTLWAEKKSFRLSSGGRFQSSDGSDWSDVPIPSQEKDRTDAHRGLDAVVRALEGDTRAMPNMVDGLAVQELVEGILLPPNQGTAPGQSSAEYR